MIFNIKMKQQKKKKKPKKFVVNKSGGVKINIPSQGFVAASKAQKAFFDFDDPLPIYTKAKSGAALNYSLQDILASMTIASKNMMGPELDEFIKIFTTGTEKELNEFLSTHQLNAATQLRYFREAREAKAKQKLMFDEEHLLNVELYRDFDKFYKQLAHALAFSMSPQKILQTMSSYVMVKDIDLTKPFLIQIADDINYSGNLGFEVKWIKTHQSAYANSQIRNLYKGQYFVFNRDKRNPDVAALYEFPSSQNFKVETDYSLIFEHKINDLDEVIWKFIYSRLVVMKKFTLDNARDSLVKRKKIFDSVPSSTNVVLLFQVIDAIVLYEFKQGTLDLDESREKFLDKLEKLKNLALGTAYHEERKLAVTKCLDMFTKLMEK